MPKNSFANITKFLSISFPLFVFISAFTGPIFAQESELVTAIIQDVGNDLVKLDAVIAEHTKLLAKYPKGDFAATVLFQLAELHEQKSNIIFSQEMAAYEKALDNYDQGILTQEPITPLLSFTKTKEYLYTLLNNFPNVAYRDKILYKLAMTHFQEGNRVKAKTYFEEIINNYPQSEINLESHFRIGEFYFDKRDFKNAAEHYSFLLGKWDNPYFDMALYKLGWSYYNLNNYPDAISIFIYLLEDLSLIENTNSATISKTKADLHSEAVQYISSCFTEYGGPQAAKEFLEKRKDKNYSFEIFLRMGELYQKRNYHPEAIETYKAMLSVYPFYEQAPEVYTQIVQNYESDSRIEEANRAREELVNKFGPGGDWIMNYPDGTNYEKAMSLARETLAYLGTFYQAEAQKTNRVRDYTLAIEKYQEFLEKFAKSPEAPKINFYLAECYYGISDFNNAAMAYHQVVTQYEPSEYSEDAAYNRVLCYYQLTGMDEKIDSLTIYIDEFLGTGEILTIGVTHQSEVDLLRSCNDFILQFPQSKWLDQVLLKYGETLHELKAYLSAVKAYKKVVELGTGRPYHLLAAMNTAQSYFDGGNFEQSEVWFRNIVQQFPDSTRFIEKASKLATSSQFKIAEKLTSEQKSKDAAALLSQIASSTDDANFRDRALFEAANQYHSSGDAVSAALSLEKLVRLNPTSELADESLYKAGGIREVNQEYNLAAADYLKLADEYPASEYAMRALKSAAICYESIQDYILAGKIYKRFVDTFPNAADDVIESLFKCGEMAYKLGHLSEAKAAFQQAVDTFRKFQNNGKDVDFYFAAHSQFMLGEIYYEDYKKVELSPPFKPNLKNKIDKFNQVLAAYKNTIEYQVADWVTAASYRIGMSFEEFVRALMEAPLPDGLNDEQIQIYKNNLTETAKPYKEQALQAYQRNIEQAEANSIDNVWIEESRKRLEILIAELRLAKPDQPIQEAPKPQNGTTSS